MATSSAARSKKQSRPARSTTYSTLLSTSDRIKALFETVCAPFDITGQQYNVLRILRGSEPQGLCRSEIAERLVRQAPDVTRLLDRLEDAKLIARQRGGEDRRYVVTRITRAGLALLTDIERQIDAIHSEQIGHLDEPQLRKLISLLAAVRRRGVKES